MRKFLLIGLGLCLPGSQWKSEETEDGAAVALSPFLAALALETGIFLLRRHHGSLLDNLAQKGSTHRQSSISYVEVRSR